MITTLTLKCSSFFFHKHVNLIKSEPYELDTSTLDQSDVDALNQYIESGGISSSNGLLVLDDTQKEEQVQDTVQEDEEKVEEEPELKLENKTAQDKPKTTVKRTTRRTTKK